MHVKVKGVQSEGTSANKPLDSTFFGYQDSLLPQAIPELMVCSF